MKIHHITGMPIEEGHGAHPVDVQVARHCDEIAKGNPARADAIRAELGIKKPEPPAALDHDLHNRLAEVEKSVGHLTGEQRALIHTDMHDRLATLEAAFKDFLERHKSGEMVAAGAVAGAGLAIAADALAHGE